MASSVYIGYLLALLITVVIAGNYCGGNSWEWDTDRDWCDDGCCGDNCCNIDAAVSVVAIVLGTIGGILALVTVLVIIFCCCRKSQGAQGRTLGTTTAGGVTGTPMQHQVIVNTGTPMTYPAYGQPPPMGAYPVTQPVGGYAAPQPMGAHAPPFQGPAGDNKWQQPPPAYDTLN